LSIDGILDWQVALCALIMPNFSDVKSDPNRARLDLLDQLVAEVQSTESSRNATPVVGTIRSTQQVSLA
jgi:hypothetical protein